MFFFSPNQSLQNEGEKHKKTYLSHGFIDFSESSASLLHYTFSICNYIRRHVF